MALIGNTTAFIPVGISCQVAHQLNANREFLSMIMREPLTYKSSFFNWVYTSAEDIPKTIQRLASHPIDQGSIQVPPAPMAASMLGDLKVWLWHEKQSQHLTDDGVREMAGKYEHLRQNFLQLASRPNRYFVLSNAQNNVADHYPAQEFGMQLSIDDALIEKIQAAVDGAFPTGSNRLIVLGKHSLTTGSKAYRLPDDTTEWEGEDRHWRQAFIKSFPMRYAYSRARAFLRPVRRAAGRLAGGIKRP